MHGDRIPGISFDDHEAEPGFAIAVDRGLHAPQQVLSKLHDRFDVQAGDLRLGRGNAGLGEHYVFKFVLSRGQDGGTPVDLGGVEQLEDGKALHG